MLDDSMRFPIHHSMSSPIPSVQTLAMDETALRMKRNPTFVPPAGCFDSIFNSKFVVTVVSASAFHEAAYMLTDNGLTRWQVNMIFRACGRALLNPPFIAKYISVMRRLASSVKARGKIVPQVRDLCITLGDRRNPSRVIDCYMYVSGKLKDDIGCLAQLEVWLGSMFGMDAIDVAQDAAMHALTCVESITDAADVVPSCSDFLAVFNAVVAVEKKNRQLVHTRLMEKYHGVHRRALELLNIPKLRIFAPMFALFPEDIPVPEAIEEFFRESEARIQRTHAIDAYHEW
jgi:hypothetical protein